MIQLLESLENCTHDVICQSGNSAAALAISWDPLVAIRIFLDNGGFRIVETSGNVAQALQHRSK
jgi:hypothetical protein